MDEKDRTNYKRAFNEKAYDRLAITIPKGKKAVIEKLAKDRGLSVNGLVNELLRIESQFTIDDWKKTN